jgi:hypothetical protein
VWVVGAQASGEEVPPPCMPSPSPTPTLPRSLPAEACAPHRNVMQRWLLALPPPPPHTHLHPHLYAPPCHHGCCFHPCAPQCPPSCTCSGEVISGCYPTVKALPPPGPLAADGGGGPPARAPRVAVAVLPCPSSSQGESGAACNPSQHAAFSCAPGSGSLLCSVCSPGWFHDGGSHSFLKHPSSDCAPYLPACVRALVSGPLCARPCLPALRVLGFVVGRHVMQEVHRVEPGGDPHSLAVLHVLHELQVGATRRCLALDLIFSGGLQGWWGKREC